jgi:hypothetical protein
MTLETNQDLVAQALDAVTAKAEKSSAKAKNQPAEPTKAPVWRRVAEVTLWMIGITFLYIATGVLPQLVHKKTVVAIFNAIATLDPNLGVIILVLGTLASLMILSKSGSERQTVVQDGKLKFGQLVLAAVCAGVVILLLYPMHWLSLLR